MKKIERIIPALAVGLVAASIGNVEAHAEEIITPVAVPETPVVPEVELQVEAAPLSTEIRDVEPVIDPETGDSTGEVVVNPNVEENEDGTYSPH